MTSFSLPVAMVASPGGPRIAVRGPEITKVTARCFASKTTKRTTGYSLYRGRQCMWLSHCLIVCISAMV